MVPSHWRWGGPIKLAGDNQIDLVVLDGTKGLYPANLDLLEDRLRPGALLVADDTGYILKYLQRERTPSLYVCVTPAAGLEMSMRAR